MAPVIPDVVRRLLDLEANLEASRTVAVVPGMVTLLVFSDDSLEAATRFKGALREHFREVKPDLFVEVLEFTFPRPHGLKAAWVPPRQFLDYQPAPVELHDLRPDLRPPPPGVARMDWNP